MQVDPKIWKKFLGHISDGHTRQDSARLARFKDLNRLRAAAQAGDTEALGMMEDIEAAEADGADRYMRNIADIAASGNLKANVEMLKLIRPERFVRITEQSIQVTHSNQAPQMLTDAYAKQRIIMLALELAKEDYNARQKLLNGLQSIPDGEIDDTPRLAESSDHAAAPRQEMVHLLRGPGVPE